MNVLSRLLHRFAYRLGCYSKYYHLIEIQKRLGALHPTAVFRLPDVCSCPEKIYLAANTSVYENSRFIISPKGQDGKFIMKSNSYAAQGLTVITGNHNRRVGEANLAAAESHEYDVDRDVIVEEDVGIGVGVTLLAGVKIGRGATVAAGSVVCGNVPPYAVVMGNPAQVIGFCFTPEEIVEHEKALYPETERLPLEKLEKNYMKHYVNQRDKIAGFMNLSLRQ